MTIIAALISKANSKGSLYPVLSFPLLLPFLIATISATWLSIEGSTFGVIWSDLQIIISYTVVTIAASFMLFDLIWND
jgi:heme exporter protein B